MTYCDNEEYLYNIGDTYEMVDIEISTRATGYPECTSFVKDLQGILDAEEYEESRMILEDVIKDSEEEKKDSNDMWL